MGSNGEGAALVQVGVSHRTTGLDVRERIHLTPEDAGALAARLARQGVEAVALSTCNRTELYLAGDRPERLEALGREALDERSGLVLEAVLMERRGADAALHLFRVASSLDSMVVGESEIQGQVRSAWELGREEGSCGPILNQLFRQALEVGKSVRSQTRIGSGSASVPAVALDLADDVLRNLPDSRVLLIGAGQMAEATAMALIQHGVHEVVVANRTVGTARELAERVGGRGVGFDMLAKELAVADIVISSTDAPHPILREADLAPVMADRPDRPMVIVDISVPRDVDPAVAGIPGVALFDIDDLERVVESNLNGRRLEAERGEGFVIGAVQGFASWRRGLNAAPAITSLRHRAETIRQTELERLEGSWEHLSEADRARVEALTKGIVNKLLHEPTVRVRAAAEDGDGEALRHLESLRHLFGLEAPSN